MQRIDCMSFNCWQQGHVPQVGRTKQRLEGEICQARFFMSGASCERQCRWKLRRATRRSSAKINGFSSLREICVRLWFARIMTGTESQHQRFAMLVVAFSAACNRTQQPVEGQAEVREAVDAMRESHSNDRCRGLRTDLCCLCADA